MAPPESAARWFVALLPDDTARRRLDALARRLQRAHPRGRRIAPGNLHLTLAFIGALPVARAQEVSDCLAALQAPHGTWSIDRVAGFARARVAWAGGAPDAQLLALAHDVREGLQRLSVAFDRAEFAPHVTLLRGVGWVPEEPLRRPIAWLLSRPQLMVSEREGDGPVRYRVWAPGA